MGRPLCSEVMATSSAGCGLLGVAARVRDFAGQPPGSSSPARPPSAAGGWAAEGQLGFEHAEGVEEDRVLLLKLRHDVQALHVLRVRGPMCARAPADDKSNSDKSDVRPSIARNNSCPELPHRLTVSARLGQGMQKQHDSTRGLREDKAHTHPGRPTDENAPTPSEEAAAPERNRTTHPTMPRLRVSL